MHLFVKRQKRKDKMKLFVGVFNQRNVIDVLKMPSVIENGKDNEMKIDSTK